MESPIYYSPIVKNLYKLKDDTTVGSNNQWHYVSDRFGEYMLMAQEQHEILMEELYCMNKCIHQNSIQNQIQHVSLNNSMAELAHGYQSFHKAFVSEMQSLNIKVDTLSNSQEVQHNLLTNTQLSLQSLPNQVKQAQEKLLTSQDLLQKTMNEKLSNLGDTLLSNQMELKNGIQNLESGLLDEWTSQNDEQHSHLLDAIHQLKELLENKNPYTYFRFGDRITLININGDRFTGVFLQSTENEVIWVNDATMSLTISNIKGMTISKG